MGSSAPAWEIVYGEEKCFKVVVNVDWQEFLEMEKSLQDSDALDVLRKCLKEMKSFNVNESPRTARKREQHRDPGKYKVRIHWPSLTLKVKLTTRVCTCDLY